MVFKLSQLVTKSTGTNTKNARGLDTAGRGLESSQDRPVFTHPDRRIKIGAAGFGLRHRRQSHGGYRPR
jgi:hypothetical protein